MQNLFVVAVLFVIGMVVGGFVVYRIARRRIVPLIDNERKHNNMFRIYNQWLRIKILGHSIPLYLQSKGYRCVAIYGMHYLGEILYEELKNSQLSVSYVIDRNAENIKCDVKVLTPDQDLMDVDAIIVTAIHYYEEIDEMLSNKVSCPILSLEDILFDV